jgi:hypothetical protein
MVARIALHRSPLVALVLLTGCSPDLSLLSAQTSFAGVSAGGDADSSVGSASGGVSGSGGSGTPSSGDAGEPTSGGDGDGDGGSGNPPTLNGGAGGAPSPAPCVATGVEVCNGSDDDCNGVVDDGCPGGVSTTFQKDLPLLGDSTGGAPFTDDCKDGEALGGVGVRVGAFLSQIHAVCRTLSLELSTNAVHGYRVKLTAERALSAHPATSADTAVNLACPPDEALVGLRLAQQYYDFGEGTVLPVITRVWVTCAQLVLVDHDGKLGIAWNGPKELAPASGSIANGTAWLVSSPAPDGLVGSRLLGAAGNWVDRVGFGVTKLDVVLR